MTETLLLVDQTRLAVILSSRLSRLAAVAGRVTETEIVWWPEVWREKRGAVREGSRAGLSCVSQCHCGERLNERVNITALSPPDTLSRMESISHSQKTR